MSDTPRTDAQEGYERHEDGPCVPASFARELECELAQAQKYAEVVRDENKAHCEVIQGLVAELDLTRAERDRIAAYAEVLRGAARKVVAWADRVHPTDRYGSEETGAWLSMEGYEALDALRAALAAEGVAFDPMADRPPFPDAR